MQVPLTSSRDSVGNSIAIIDARNLVDIVDLIRQIKHIITQMIGNPSFTFNTLQKQAQTANNDPFVLRNNRDPDKFEVQCQLNSQILYPSFQQLFPNLIDNARASLDTFHELANALSYDANDATTIWNQLALQANLSYVDCALALKQPAISSAADLDINKLITIMMEPPTGFTDRRPKAETVNVGKAFSITTSTTTVHF